MHGLQKVRVIISVLHSSYVIFMRVRYTLTLVLLRTIDMGKTLPHVVGLALVKRFKLYNYMRIKYKLSCALNSQIIIPYKPCSAPRGELG